MKLEQGTRAILAHRSHLQVHYRNIYKARILVINMKNLIIIGIFAVLAFSILALAKPDLTPSLAIVNPSNGNANIIIPENAVEVSPGVFSLGIAIDKGRIVEGYAFVDYKKEAVKPNSVRENKGGNVCYALLSKGAKWKTTENYVLDASNNDGLTESFVASKTEDGLNAWDSEVGFDIFGNRNLTSSVNRTEIGKLNGKNEIFFDTLSDGNTIAVTIVWGIWGGPIFGRNIVEFDMIFNDDAFEFGDADLNSSVMDYLNIFTHEIGHGAGMGHPSDFCTEETMFRYASLGESEKRTLEIGDETGIKALYP